MKQRLWIILLALLVVGASESKGQDDYVKRVEIDTLIDNINILDSAFMVAGVKMRFPIRIINTGTPECRYAAAMSFVIESPDGAEWVASELREYDLSHWEVLPGIFIPRRMPDLFYAAFYESFSYDGKGGDTIGFAGLVSETDKGIYNGFDARVWQLDVTPSIESAGKTICIDFGGQAINGYEWGWYGLSVNSQSDCSREAVIPEWGGPYCFEILSADFNCCGQFLEGLTGNIDCDPDGRRNLADITRLIDRLYITHKPLCCVRNGNTNADWQGDMNLADLTKLIDHVYVSQQELENCQ